MAKPGQSSSTDLAGTVTGTGEAATSATRTCTAISTTAFWTLQIRVGILWATSSRPGRFQTRGRKTLRRSSSTTAALSGRGWKHSLIIHQLTCGETGGALRTCTNSFIYSKPLQKHSGAEGAAQVPEEMYLRSTRRWRTRSMTISRL